jgi:uncharacterized protein YbjT (DUF2867 family)
LPWTYFDILHDLERTAGNPEAAAEARRRAVAAYLAYRRDGGEPQFAGGRLCAAVAQALAAGKAAGALAQLAAVRAEPDLPANLKPALCALEAIVQGSRDPALAEDPALDYADAAELLLLLEKLGAASGAAPPVPAEGQPLLSWHRLCLSTTSATSF